jgi:hypothetical protein
MLALKWFPQLFTNTQERNLHKNINNYYYTDFVEQGEWIRFKWTPKNEEPTTKNQPPCQMRTKTAYTKLINKL